MSINLEKVEALHLNLIEFITGEIPYTQIAEDLTFHSIITDADAGDPDTKISIMSTDKLNEMHRLVRLISQLYVKKKDDDDPLWQKIGSLLELT